MAKDATIYLDPEYNPTEKQAEAHSSTARLILFGGGVGAGKSHVLVRDALAHMVQYPGIRCLLGRYNLIDLRRTTELEWKKVVNEDVFDPKGGGKHTISPPYYRLPNGSELFLTSLMDWESWLSAELGWIGIDECNQVAEEALDGLETRLRWTTGAGNCQRPACLALPTYRPHFIHPHYRIMMACNPNPQWPKRRFYDPWAQGQERKNHHFVQSKTSDNVVLPPDYEASLRLRNPTWVRRMLDGDWTAFEGSTFEVFNRGIHVWREEKDEFQPDNHSGRLPEFEMIVGGIDYGATTTYAHRTTAYLTGLMPDGRMLTFWEYSKQGPAAGDFWDKVGAANRIYNPETWFADASQHRVKELAADRGISISDASRAKGSRGEGITMMIDALTPMPGVGPRWLIHERCPRLIEGIEVSHEVPREKAMQGYGPVPDEPVRRDDDEVDAARYNLMGLLGMRPAILSREIVVRTDEPATRRSTSTIMEFRREEKKKRLAIAMADFAAKDREQEEFNSQAASKFLDEVYRRGS